MTINLQAPVARVAATILLLLCTCCRFPSDLTAEADMAFERRGYFEAAKYVALYAKVSPMWN